MSLSNLPSQHCSQVPSLTVELAAEPGDGGDTLAVFAFGAGQGESIVHVGLTPLGEAPVYELWRTTQPINAGCRGDLQWRATRDLFFGSISVSLAGDPVEQTRVLYRQVLDGIQASGYPYLLRIWNFMPQINAGRGDGERYKCFSVGRGMAFDESAVPLVSLPAATAIGTRSGDHLLVYFLAAREPGQRLENPRQVSAFDYPRRYGPRSPLFSRAALLPQGGQSLLLVSGTASIVGHESRHPGDLDGQLQETWRNIEQLCIEAGSATPQLLRVYVRYQADYPAVARFVSERVAGDVQVVYLLSDICRAELLVEIEGVYRVPTPAEP